MGPDGSLGLVSGLTWGWHLALSPGDSGRQSSMALMKNAGKGQEPGEAAELLWIQNNNPDDPGPDRPGCGESGRISKWHMTDAKDDTVHGNLRGNLEMLQNIQSHGGWYSRDEIIIQVKLFKLECVWFPLRAQSQPASPFTNSWWLFMPSAGNYRSQILNSSKHKIRLSCSPGPVAPAGTVLNNSNVFTTTTQT